MKKRILSMLLVGAMAISLSACDTSDERIDLSGNWEQEGKEDSYQAGYISEDMIEIFWIFDGTKALYWSGSYEAPTDNVKEYSWESENNKEKTDSALLASGDDFKTFTYQDGKISYDVSVQGVTRTITLIPTNTDYSENMEDNQESMESDISDQLEIIAEYTLPDGIGWYTRHFMVVKNNSNETVDISTSSLAYSKDGTLLGANDTSFNALGAGCTSVMYEAFEIEAEIDHYETELKASPSKYYDSVIQDLEYVQNDIDGGAVFQVTNTGDQAAEFVEGYALFFLGDELVGYENTYFTDDDSEIKPGETISKQMTSYEHFDRIEFYLTGRR